MYIRIYVGKFYSILGKHTIVWGHTIRGFYLFYLWQDCNHSSLTVGILKILKSVQYGKNAEELQRFNVVEFSVLFQILFLVQ